MAREAGALDNAGWNEFDILRRAHRNRGSLARQPPIIKEAFRDIMLPRQQSDHAAFSIDLRQHRRLLLRAPNSPPIRRLQNVKIVQKGVLLESRERLQGSANALREATPLYVGRLPFYRYYAEFKKFSSGGRRLSRLNHHGIN
jgi:hypothetical protein